MEQLFKYNNDADYIEKYVVSDVVSFDGISSSSSW